MSDRSKRISKLLASASSRASYIRAKLNVLIPSQIRALRLKSNNMTQQQLAALADMAQPRISAMERPGETKFNIDTLVRLAAAFKVGLKVEFVPFSEMLAWENNFSQDQFDVRKIDDDLVFIGLNAAATATQRTVSCFIDLIESDPIFTTNQIISPVIFQPKEDLLKNMEYQHIPVYTSSGVLNVQ